MCMIFRPKCRIFITEIIVPIRLKKKIEPVLWEQSRQRQAGSGFDILSSWVRLSFSSLGIWGEKKCIFSTQKYNMWRSQKFRSSHWCWFIALSPTNSMCWFVCVFCRFLKTWTCPLFGRSPRHCAAVCGRPDADGSRTLSIRLFFLRNLDEP